MKIKKKIQFWYNNSIIKVLVIFRHFNFYNLKKAQTNLQNIFPLLHRLLLARHLVERLFLCDVIGRLCHVTFVVGDVTLANVAPVARGPVVFGGGGRDEGGLLHFGGVEQLRGILGVSVGCHRRFSRLRVVGLLWKIKNQKCIVRFDVKKFFLSANSSNQKVNKLFVFS